MSGQNMKCSTLWLISDVLETDLVVFGASKVEEEEKISQFFGFQVEGQVVGSTSVGTGDEKDIFKIYNLINTTPSYV